MTLTYHRLNTKKYKASSFFCGAKNSLPIEDTRRGLLFGRRQEKLSMTSIRVLKTFLAVVEQGSFAAAGNQVGLTPAAVALQIKTLERTSSSSCLTAAGDP